NNAETHEEIARFDNPPAIGRFTVAPTGRWLAFGPTSELNLWDEWLDWLTGTHPEPRFQFDVVSLENGKVTKSFRDDTSEVIGFTPDDHIWTSGGYDLTGLGKPGPTILREWSARPTRPPLWLWLLTGLGMGHIFFDLRRTHKRRSENF